MLVWMVVVFAAWMVVAGCSPEDVGTGRDAGGRRDAGRDGSAPLDGAGPDVPGDDDAGMGGARAHDLDRDGVPETDLGVAMCPGDAARLCLVAETDARTWGVMLPAGAKPAGMGSATVIGRPMRVIGDHAGGALSEVSVLFQLGRGMHDSPALAVIDVEAEVIVATTSAPEGIAMFAQYALASFTDYVRAPDGRLHPFLAPGYGDSAERTWGYACVFHAGAAASARCGPGFVEASTIPEGGFFREVGGYLQDLDADGWEDVNLIFHSKILSFSARTGAPLVTTTYDVAAADEPSSPVGFHSGRNYGTHASFTGADGLLRNVIVAGAPIGSFGDANCNVSRYVAVLESTAGVPASRTMRWSDYFGFGSSIFIRYDPAYASDPSADLARLGDFMDGCIHRFSDSRTTIDGVEAVIFDYFVADAPVDSCLDEQYQLYLPPAWTEEKARIWYECFGSNVGSIGIWGMQARRVSDGASITGSQRTYVWGRSDRLLPGGEIVYLVETLPERTRFDLADVVPTPLAVNALVAGLWTGRGTFPIAARPVIAHVPAEGATGVGSNTALAELDLADRDGDGLAEVHLEGDVWVGWDAAATAFVVK
jgi:hypothetical protein